MTARWRWTMLICALVGAQAVMVAVVSRSAPAHGRILGLQLAGFAVSLLVLAVLRHAHLPTFVVTSVLLAGCILLQVAALLGPPVTSDDDYRYAWDATVQLSGTDPYRYAPANPLLTDLRTEFTFPVESPCRHHVLPQGGCTRINRPTVRTIYPPVAEAAFDGIWIGSAGGRGGHRPLQIAAALGVLLTAMVLLQWSKVRGTPRWWVAVWALSPVVAVEATNNAHIDWLAALLTALALLAVAKGRRLSAGVAIGAAIATKFFPGLLLVMAGRRPWRMAVGAFGVLVLGYLPHVIAVGPSVIGYLPGYLQEESYTGGSRYLLTAAVIGDHAAALLTPVILVAVLLVLWWRCDVAHPERTAVTAAGLYFLLTTPSYPWYILLLVVLIAASGHLRWLWLCIAPTITYLHANLPGGSATATWGGYVAAAGVAAGCAWWSRRGGERRSPWWPGAASSVRRRGAGQRT